MLDTYFIIMVVVLALVFDFINGFHDTANAIATCVSTRAIRPGIAIVGTAVLNFIGAMISTGVAKTIGGDIVVSPAMINELIIIAGLTGAIAWNLLTWWFGMPSSSSHALIGGMIGAILISVGTAALNDWGIIKIVLSLIISPVTAIVMGYIIMNILFIICRNYKPAKINITANRLQVISAALMAFLTALTMRRNPWESSHWHLYLAVLSTRWKFQRSSNFSAPRLWHLAPVSAAGKSSVLSEEKYSKCIRSMALPQISTRQSLSSLRRCCICLSPLLTSYQVPSWVSVPHNASKPSIGASPVRWSQPGF